MRTLALPLAIAAALVLSGCASKSSTTSTQGNRSLSPSR